MPRPISVPRELAFDTFSYLLRNRYRTIKATDLIQKMNSTLQQVRVVFPREFLKPGWGTFSPRTFEKEEAFLLGTKKKLIKYARDLRDIISKIADETEPLIERWYALPSIKRKFREVAVE